MAKGIQYILQYLGSLFVVVGTGDKYCLWNMRDNIKAQPRSFEWRELNHCVLKDNPKIKRKACWFYVSAPVV